MNIFVTSADPQACAEALDDKRLIKMILESAQLLCTVLGGKYKPTHVNHPCTIWVRSSLANGLWLHAHAIFMCEEYMKRFAKEHASQAVIEETFKRLYTLPDLRKDKSEGSKEKLFPTDWVNVTDHKDIPDTFLAYRLALNNKWDKDARPPVWTNRKPPSWARWRSIRETVVNDPVVTSRYHYSQKNSPVKGKQGL